MRPPVAFLSAIYVSPAAKLPFLADKNNGWSVGVGQMAPKKTFFSRGVGFLADIYAMFRQKIAKLADQTRPLAPKRPF
ncbi:MAG: hypothetical protein IPK82_34490 [Polyangiaceae bacterium]|nr:hypothetical protein [Polyangiaceae bacterium]